MVFWKLHGIKPKECHYVYIDRLQNCKNNKFEFDNLY